MEDNQKEEIKQKEEEKIYIEKRLFLLRFHVCPTYFFFLSWIQMKKKEWKKRLFPLRFHFCLADFFLILSLDSKAERYLLILFLYSWTRRASRRLRTSGVRVSCARKRWRSASARPSGCPRRSKRAARTTSAPTFSAMESFATRYFFILSIICFIFFSPLFIEFY